MLSTSTAIEDDAWFTAWRNRELRRVVRSGVSYLDYTGAALYPESLVRADARRLVSGVFGNPHSEHDASRAASASIAEARAALLDFVHAPPDEYTVVLTANASGACRLVGEGFPFGHGSTFLHSADNHNSVNGIREFARQAGARLQVIPLDADLCLCDADEALAKRRRGHSLFAFPAQSNFSGVRHPIDLVQKARERGWRVLLDAASFVPTSDLDLREVPADFVALSLYKIAGYPTGLGALIARKDALAMLRRPWFSGGTVQWVSVQHRRHRLFEGPEGFEDGTPSFLSAAAVAPALAAMRAPGRDRLARHLQCLTSRLLDGLAGLRHVTGRPIVTVHGPATTAARGATVAISVRDVTGTPVPYWTIEQAARDAGVAIRGGCFCNPGCAEAAFDFPPDATRECLNTMGADFSIPRFAECLGGQAVGAIRISMGLGSVTADVDRVLVLLAAYAGRRAAA